LHCAKGKEALKGHADCLILLDSGDTTNLRVAGGPVLGRGWEKEGTSMQFSENIARLQPSATLAVSTLAKKLKAEGRDVVDLSAGQPDFDTPEFIAEAGIQGIRDGHTRYTPTPGTPALRKAIAATYSHRLGQPVDPSCIVVNSGAKHSLFNAMFSLFGPGDRVLIPVPYWTSYPEMVTLARAEAVPVVGDPARDFHMTPEDLEGAYTPQVKGLLLCTPSNPSGGVYSLDELRAVVEWARARDIWIIADEIYRLINFKGEGPAPSVLELPEASRGNVVVVDGASKAFAMTGWRIGHTYSDPALAKKMSDLQSHMTSNPSAPAQQAVLAAYTQWDRSMKEVRRMVEAFKRRRDLATRLFEELLPAFSYVKPDGAFYLYFRVDSLFDEELKDSSAVCTWLLEEAEIALVPGAAFGDDRYVRMSYATSDELLEEGIRRLAKAVVER
jgi:aspartate/methionine/tyrosine aminotransferase